MSTSRLIISFVGTIAVLLLSISSLFASEEFDYDFQRALRRGDWQIVLEKLEPYNCYPGTVSGLIHGNACLALDLPCARDFFEDVVVSGYDLEDCELWLRDFELLEPKRAVAFQLNGCFELLRGSPKKAIKSFDKAVKLDDHLYTAYLLRGYTYQRLGEFESANKDYRRVLELKPNSSLALTAIGTVCDTLGQYESALDAYHTALVCAGDSSTIYFYRGNTYRHMHKSREAISDYTAALRVDSTLTAAYLNRGNSYSDLGQQDSALADYEAFVAQAKGQISSRVPEIRARISSIHQSISAKQASSPSLELDRGKALFDKSQFDDAIAAFNRAIDLNPGDNNAYYFRAAACFSKGDLGKAIQDFSTAISLYKWDTTAYYNRGICRSRLGDYENAQADFSSAIRCDELYTNAYRERAWVRAQLDDDKGAQEDIRTALAIQRPVAAIDKKQVRQLTPVRLVNDTDAKQAVEKLFQLITAGQWEAIPDCFSDRTVDALYDVCIARLKPGENWIELYGRIYSMERYRGLTPDVFLEQFAGDLHDNRQRQDSTFLIHSATAVDAASFPGGQVMVRSRVSLTRQGQLLELELHHYLRKESGHWALTAPDFLFELF
jgi:tetratricopeptide (TPR) repeat protein